MRVFIHWLSGLAVLAGMGVIGYQNPALGVVLVFGGAALWLASQKGAFAVIRRSVKSVECRKVGTGKIGTKQEAREQFALLNKAEREGLKIFMAHGTAMPDRIISRLRGEGYGEPERIFDSIRSKTSFLVGSFSGEFSINPSMKDALAGCGKMNQSSNLLVSLNEDSTSYAAISGAKCPDFTLLVHFSAAC